MSQMVAERKVGEQPAEVAHVREHFVKAEAEFPEIHDGILALMDERLILSNHRRAEGVLQQDRRPRPTRRRGGNCRSCEAGDLCFDRDHRGENWSGKVLGQTKLRS